MQHCKSLTIYESGTEPFHGVVELYHVTTSGKVLTLWNV